MSKRVGAWCTVVVVLVLFGASSPVGAALRSDADRAGRSTWAGRSDRAFTTILTGWAEVPGPGDPDGLGQATILPNTDQGEVCYEITVANIALPVTAAHIHAGSPFEAGPVVVTLFEGTDEDGFLSGCVSADPAVLAAIQSQPWDYYVNVHNVEYPAGAVRGQLF